jgi:hypothetical protein
MKTSVSPRNYPSEVSEKFQHWVSAGLGIQRSA